MSLPYPSRNQWSALWGTTAVLSFVWIGFFRPGVAPFFEVLGPPVAAFAVLIFWKYYKPKTE